MLLLGFGLGVLLAAQVGPVTLLIVRTALRGGRAVVVGLAMALAVAGVDVLYAALGLLGLGAATDAGVVRLVLGLASGGLLVAIGARTLWLGFRARAGLETAEEVVAPGHAFATALAATALNPLTIALWTVSFPAAAPSAAGAPAAASLLLAGVALGTLTWYGGFSTAAALVRGRLGPRVLAVVDVVTGAGLVVFGSILAFRAVDER
jgi:threonine/homoserine/homoserine lactone efflux protein